MQSLMTAQLASTTGIGVGPGIRKDTAATNTSSDARMAIWVDLACTICMPRLVVCQSRQCTTTTSMCTARVLDTWRFFCVSGRS
mmetsp:Transcript_71546/g.99402  ORF Transcript_71546/g.99402 Transcript_71546/m.99402 type:complete len:84 (-) Transcript_71546:439-690(-)